MKIGPLTISRYDSAADLKPGPEESPTRRRIERGELGATGTRFFSGMLYNEEYNTDLQGEKGIDIYTRMAMADPTVKAVERAVTLPIRGAIWSVEPATDSARDREIAEFCEHNMHSMKTPWDSQLRQVLLHLRYGRYIFEKVFAEEAGQYVWDKWAPRMPKTIYRHYFEQNGDLAGIQQRVWKLNKQGSGMGVIANGTFEFIDIEASRLLLFVNDQEGSNYEGTSLFRAAYRPWWFRENLERIVAIGAERRELGVEYAKMSEDANKDDSDAVAAALASLHAHEQGYIIFPSKVTEQGIFGMGEGGAGVSGSIAVLQYFRQEIANQALAEFLTMGGENGTQAMHRDKTSFFLLALRAVSDNVSEVMNRDALKQLVDINFGPQKEYPGVKVTRLETRNMGEYAKAILDLSNASALTPDRVIEEAIRHELDLPDMQEDENDPEADAREERRNPAPLPPFGQQQPPNPDDVSATNPDRAARRKEMRRRQSWRGYSTTRERRPAEKFVNLGALENRMNRGQQRIVRAAQEVQERQIDKLVELATGIVESDAAARVDRIEVPYSGQMATAIIGELKDLYEFGRAEARREIADAGVARAAAMVLEAEPEKIISFLTSRARAVASILAAKLKSTFAMETLQQVKTGVADPERLRRRLTELSTRDLEASARASVSEAVNLGREATAEQMEDEIEYAEYSCLLDSSSCQNCTDHDGQRYQVGTAEYYLNRPPLTECDGGNQCRCIFVYVMMGEA